MEDRENVLPDLVDNRHITETTLAEVVKTLLSNSRSPSLSIATAYFNLESFSSLEPELHNLTSLRLLIGKEQDQTFVVPERLKQELQESLSLPNGSTSLNEIKKWQEFLSQNKVQVRLYRRAFLHGKAYLLSGLGIHGTIGTVGSSNFTGAGLNTNLELNALLRGRSATEELARWFDALWQDSDDYKPELLAMLSLFTKAYSPYETYIKIIYEAYRHRFEDDLSEKGGKPSPIALADFQHEGYLSAKEIVENYGGVLIADSVGLGKTFLALRLLDDYAYKERSTALIICPASLIDTLWKPFLRDHSIPAETVSIEKISQKNFPIEEYADYRVIVVDESHNFRNDKAKRWNNLYKLLTTGDTEKTLILLTATPVNNTVFDLYNQLRLITRDTKDYFASAGIANLRSYFISAERNRNALYELLEAIAVRRSRQFIKRNYPKAEIDGQKIHFPERELISVRYSLEKSYGAELYAQISSAIEHLILAPYQVDTFRKEIIESRRRFYAHSLFDDQMALKDHLLQLGRSEQEAQEFVMLIGRQTALAHIMRVLYLKRLESSVDALKISIQRQRDFQRAFLRALEHRKLLNTDSYRRWLQFETSDEIPDDEENWNEILENLPPLNPDDYDVDKIRRALDADVQTLGALIKDLELLSPESDHKLQTLKAILSRDLRGKKVIIFSYFKDTARYIYHNLLEDKEFLETLGHSQLSIVDSNVDPRERKDRIRRFAPEANKAMCQPQKEIKLLISTDVLSEGHNLQDADTIINYDLHWNPVRMAQRIGRLDRIGSPHDRIFVYNFFPEDALERILGLMERLHEKLEQINRAVGLDASVLGEKPNPMDFNTLRRIAHEDKSVVDELERRSELLVGEFLFEDLLDFLKKAGTEKLMKIPLGVGTAMRSNRRKTGFFAAFRRKTDENRYNNYWLFLENPDTESEKIVTNRLDAIRNIRCKPKEPAAPLPPDFDPQPFIEKLRSELLTRLRQSIHRLPRIAHPQNRILEWLHALPTSRVRNELISYFREPLPDPLLSELRKLWKGHTRLSEAQRLNLLSDFAKNHPILRPSKPVSTRDITHRELECVGWMLVT